MSQYPIPEGLSPAEKNKLTNYWPIRNKGNEFDWETVTGVVLSLALRQQVATYELVQFKDDCKQKFTTKLDDPNFWAVLERTYFSNDSLFQISPLFLLFKAKGRQNGRADIAASDLRLCKLFAGLLGNFFLEEQLGDRLNFIEEELLSVLRANLKAGGGVENDEQPYLPFLNKVFRDDISFLASNPQYLLQALPGTLKLYSFAYCAQLALNVTDWQNEPQSKRLYFILDSEKASSERTSLKRSGYKLLAAATERVFPLLSALDVFQLNDSNKKRPLWQVYQDILKHNDHSRLLKDLNKYLQDFIDKRKLETRLTASSVDAAFEQLKELALEQFRDAQTTRSGVNNNYIKEVNKRIFVDFVQVRGSSGRTLVLNQDQMILLTNLTIGKADKLRLHELRRGFEQRGFYLDNQSLQVLISFYERMGNVERMSDSGDAVYVRKTL
ncbi:DNA phosphorothioation-dependent restriction protein DptG [Yersinia intermedia]|uniref:DNA phosphorothioation-dependent restriction protein DptG n=1 Tax=Yersinia intermedia TaxID=631 RepID=UPI0005E92E63|nr:DNA phosphorothioation-dependent restriction protein DptG [Yersinia intermedia]CNB54538.1 DNA phosphorothioation-dependent restriction protein DptG [Yersinia intermedia]CRF12963.1 DNA phosphorothioation-dependent restriction protein DptG [Yersinia intermedia]